MLWFLWKESFVEKKQQGGADYSCSQEVGGRAQAYHALFCLQRVNPVSVITAVIVVVVVVMLVYSTLPCSHCSLRLLQSLGEAWSLEQGGEFLDAAFTAPADV